MNSAHAVGNTFLALHAVLRDHGLLLVGYDQPIGFSYWTGGLEPLFNDIAFGQLAHQVCTDFGIADISTYSISAHQQGGGTTQSGHHSDTM